MKKDLIARQSSVELHQVYIMIQMVKLLIKGILTKRLMVLIFYSPKPVGRVLVLVEHYVVSPINVEAL